MSNKPVKQPAGSPQWMIVYVTYDIHEAHIVAGRLESDGIPAMVNQQIGAAALGIRIGGLGEIRVLVHLKDYDTAVDLLNPDESDLLNDDNQRTIFGDFDGNDDE